MEPRPKAKPKRLLGIDYGLKRLGLAISDERQLIAMPFQTLLAEPKLEQTAAKLIACLAQFQQDQPCDIEEIVMGLPLMMSGRKGFLADEVAHFRDILSQHTSVPIQMWDERLTTVQAERSLRESQMTRKKRSKLIDTTSAIIILQSYLDYRALRRLK